VQRNRIKRRLRAAIRETGLPVGFDYVLIGGPQVIVMEFSTLKTWLEQASR
jgi:ribonuclease P protein component